MKITNKYVFFWGSEFSNWFKIDFEYKGHKFANTEQAFMWEKAVHFGDDEIAEKCLKETNPKEVKKLGRQISNFDADSWSKVSYQIMVDVNIPKWEKLKDKLLATGNRTLVEASPYDKIWGIGMHENDAGIEDESNWQGMNLLGKALMEVRTKLK